MIPIYTCVACGELFEPTRIDALSCSATCRVRAHRNGSADALRRLAAAYKIPPHLIREADALNRLVPSAAARVRSGELELKQARPLVRKAYLELLFAEAHDEPF